MIEAGASVGEGAQIGAHSVIGANASVGAGTRFAPRVTFGAGCSIGARGIVHSGAVIGADGFGFAPTDGRWEKIEQLGAVRIGDDVEIGANTCIDRGALDDTVIEDGVKLDNQIQIGHNVRIGAHTAMAGCVGVAGSAVIGKHCTVGGAGMVLGHLELADHVHISAGSMVTRSIHKPGVYTGVFPIDDNASWEKNAATLRQLHSLRDRLRALEKSLPEQDQRSEDSMTMDIHEILKHLPHRYPFLLVDRVLELDKGKRIKALKNVTINEPYFAGHFPHRPVMPGVLILEALAQAAAILAFDTMGVQPDDKTVFYFAGIDGARFKRPVEPGDQLMLDVDARPHQGRHRQVHGAGHGRRRNSPPKPSCCARCAASPDALAAARHGQRSTPRRSSKPAPSSTPRSASAPTASCASTCASARGTTIGPHCVIEGHTTIGARQPHLPVLLDRRRAAGQEVRRRADRAGDRRPQHDPRVLHLQPRHRAGRRRHARRRRQLDHGLRAHRARLQLGNQTILANNATLAGHVHVGDWVIVGGLTGVHQFVKIGAHAMVGFPAPCRRTCRPS